MAIRRITVLNQRGFTLVEVLFSLSICLLIVLNTVPVLKLITAKDKLSMTTSNYAIGAKQLTQILYCAKDITVADTLSFKNSKDELFTISLNDHRIVKEPGFDIIIRDVDTVNFYHQDKNIYMEITCDDQAYLYLIGVDYQEEIEPSEGNEQDEIVETPE